MSAAWRPSRTHALLLHAAFDRDAEAVAEAWAAWRGIADIATCDDASIRLLPLVARSLALHRIDDPEQGRLQGLRRHGFVEHTRHLEAVRPVVAALTRAGVRFVVLGALGSARRFFGELGLRTTSDSGLLVVPDDVPKAVRCLRELGFLPLGTHPPTLADALSGHTNLAEQGYGHALRWARSDGLALDLAWALLPSQVGRESDREVVARAEPTSSGGLKIMTLAACDALLLALMRGPTEDPSARCDSAIDALALLEHARTDPLDWVAFTAEAGRRGIDHVLRDRLGYLAAEFAAAIPPGVMERLCRGRGAAPPGRLGALGPYLDRRGPLDAALVSARFAVHRLSPAPALMPLRPLMRPLWRAWRRLERKAR